MLSNERAVGLVRVASKMREILTATGSLFTAVVDCRMAEYNAFRGPTPTPHQSFVLLRFSEMLGAWPCSYLTFLGAINDQCTSGRVP